MCCAAGRSSADDDGNRRNPASRGRGRGRPTEELGDGPVLRTMAGSDVGESPSTEVTPHREDDYIGEDGEDDDDDETEAFKDEIMKQLEEKAFSIEEAHNILTIQFGTSSGDRVKDAVLSEWCGEVGLTAAIESMSTADRLDALGRELLRAGVFGRQAFRVSTRAVDLFWPVRGLPGAARQCPRARL